MTPGQQAPLGPPLTLERRLRLLDWAAARQVWVIEDDYLSELQLAGRAAPALASLDRDGRVIHIDSFSKTISPSVRLGFLVAPVELISRFTDVPGCLAPAPGPAVQLATAEFMREGHYMRHLRRTKRAYAAKRHALLDCLQAAAGAADQVTAPGLAVLLGEEHQTSPWFAKSRRSACPRRRFRTRPNPGSCSASRPRRRRTSPDPVVGCLKLSVGSLIRGKVEPRDVGSCAALARNLEDDTYFKGVLALPATIRAVDLETAGNGPHDVCEIGWQDVVQGPDGVWNLSDERGSMFVNPGRPISPETMAVHHILDDQVAHAPFWRVVAPDVLRPAGGALALAAHRAAFEQRYCRPVFTGGADWICTWKCALRLWPELPSFSNQMLRYCRRPEGLVHERGLPAHRALPDAYVTAHHLRDMLNEASAAQLIAWSREPGLLPRVPSGPDRGKAFGELGSDALRILARDRDIDVRFSAETELQQRGEVGPLPAKTPAQQSLL